MAVNLSNLKPPRGSRHRKVRVGRGIGSKLGKTAGKGNKGQKSRKGYSRRAGFEGGQMPLRRRIPKRGFHNPTRVEYAVVNVECLNIFPAGTKVTRELLIASGLIRQVQFDIKVLGDGELTTALTVHAHKFSKSASDKIAAAGGKAESSVMNQFFEAFANMFRIPDLRKRLLFTLAMLAVYRLGAFLPTPGINTDVLAQFFQQNQGSVLGVIDLFSGGNFRRLTIFALGIMPYITASIILQLMTVVWPYLERLQKEGELGRRKITQYTRYLTILLSVVQSFSIAITLEKTGGPNNQPLVYNPGVGFVLMTILTLTTGSAFIMWLGEQITERGVGNGMSLIIFAGIVVGLPRAVSDLFDKFRTAQWGPFTGLALIFLMALMIAVDRCNCLCGGRAAPHSGAVRQARDGPAHDGRADDLPAAARQFRRRDSADFCQLAADVSGHHQPVPRTQVQGL